MIKNRRTAFGYVLIFIFITGALGLAGSVFSVGRSFGRWNDAQKIGYFVDLHSRLLGYAGIAIWLLCFALGFGLLAAFARIRALEALIRDSGRRA